MMMKTGDGENNYDDDDDDGKNYDGDDDYDCVWFGLQEDGFEASWLKVLSAKPEGKKKHMLINADDDARYMTIFLLDCMYEDDDGLKGLCLKFWLLQKGGS